MEKIGEINLNKFIRRVEPVEKPAKINPEKNSAPDFEKNKKKEKGGEGKGENIDIEV